MGTPMTDAHLRILNFSRYESIYTELIDQAWYLFLTQSAGRMTRDNQHQLFAMISQVYGNITKGFCRTHDEFVTDCNELTELCIDGTAEEFVSKIAEHCHTFEKFEFEQKLRLILMKKN